jgi:hypothetical protein
MYHVEFDRSGTCNAGKILVTVTVLQLVPPCSWQMDYLVSCGGGGDAA